MSKPAAAASSSSPSGANWYSSTSFILSMVVAIALSAFIVINPHSDAAAHARNTSAPAVNNATAGAAAFAAQGTSGYLVSQLAALAAAVQTSYSAVDPLTFKLLITALTLALILVLDQWNFHRLRNGLPGPKFVPPLIGFFYDSVYPTFEGYLRQWNLGPLSCTSVFQKFIIIASSNDLARKIFNTPNTFSLCLVAAMKDIIRADNFVFMEGKAHNDYRKSLNPLFTPSALNSYIPLQTASYEKHIDEWLKLGGKPDEYQTRCRELNMETSLVVFCGNWMEETVRQTISQRYYDLTAALQLVNFPLAIPGTNVYRAIQARKYIVAEVAKCAVKSRAYMSVPGNQPTCLLDTWFQAQFAALATAKAANAALNQGGDQDAENGPTPPRQFNDEEVGMTVFTFMFASQDASTSSVTWLLACLADNPDVLAKVREEQFRVRPNNEPIDGDNLKEMVYTRQVAKEVLRYRPPVIMVPYEAKKDTLLGEQPIPKGTIIVSSIWPSQHDPSVYASPDKFDPDRFGPDRQEDTRNPKHWLIFGHGPHGCLGKEYAVNHLICLAAYMSTRVNWTRTRTPESDDITVFATIYPKDRLILSVTPLAK